MKLSNISDKKLSDDSIGRIVYSNIKDNGLTSKYALVFGNEMLIKQRVNKAVEIYKSNRVEKLIFMGGVNGVSNQNKSVIPEAIKMKKLAIDLGVNENDILIDDLSNNTFENIDNAFEIIGDEIKKIDNIIVITSEFHLKRCYAIIKKKCPHLNISLVSAKDGFSDSNNWFLSDGSWNTGRSIVTYEANLLIKYAKEEKILDLDVEIESRDER